MQSAHTRHCQSPESSNKRKPCNRCSVQSSPKIQANNQYAGPELLSGWSIICYKRIARRKTSVSLALEARI